MELINRTIGQCLEARAQSNGEHIAVEMDGWSCTFRQLDVVSDILAGRMLGLGIKGGTHVGIWGINSPNWVFTFLALTKIGAVPVLINTCYKQEEIKGILNYSDVETLYYGTGYKTSIYEEIISDIKDALPKIRHYVHMEETGVGPWLALNCFSEEERSLRVLENVQKAKEQVRPEDHACMIFTSGTMSLPKGVMLSHYNLVNNARALVEAMRWGTEDKMCITVPMFHCFGITAGIVACVVGGMSMHLIAYFRTGRVWDAIDNSRCTILNGVPSMFLALIHKQCYAGRKAEHLKSGIIAGSAISGKDYLEICARFPGMHLQPSYGQSETSPCVTIAGWDDDNEKKAVSAGKPIDHVEVRIVDLKTGEKLGIDMDGEIQVRGYNVMSGYYQLPKANARAFTEDGWLRTGDIGRLDRNGALHLTGRLKEMIIRAGENISPYEIEAVIRQLEWVQSVKVVGIPAQVLQEEIAACIIPKQGCKVEKDVLLEYLKPRLAHYKIPAYVLGFDAFPFNASGKINLKVLKDMASERAGQERKQGVSEDSKTHVSR